MGAADNPDLEDYYNKSRVFPLTYSPDDDPEVVEDMRVAAAELERGGDDDGKNEGNHESSDSSGSNESGAEGVGEGGDEDWNDDDEGAAIRSMGRKTMSVIDKV
jgi:hypothetical protein